MNNVKNLVSWLENPSETIVPSIITNYKINSQSPLDLIGDRYIRRFWFAIWFITWQGRHRRCSSLTSKAEYWFGVISVEMSPPSRPNDSSPSSLRKRFSLALFCLISRFICQNVCTFRLRSEDRSRMYKTQFVRNCNSI